MKFRSITQIFGLIALFSIAAMAVQRDITGPQGSGFFGGLVETLPNGNFVVLDPYWDNGATLNVGAVYLYSSNGTLINTLIGSTAYDEVGLYGAVILPNGNYVVFSPTWNNATTMDVGAVTYCNGNTGCPSNISAANSLVGSTAGDRVGNDRAVVLANGNYVVPSTYWTNGANAFAGAVTWCNGATGRSGVVSAANSLIGSRANDLVGSSSVTALANGNYVVASRNWDNGSSGENAGAVTWGNGSSGIFGVVSSANSLVGTTAEDNVGTNGVVALANGNYVVPSINWDGPSAANVGAVTFGNGSTGITGIISSSNSLIGSTADDQVGRHIVALNNGNYVVDSNVWDNGAEQNVGAVTWCNGSTGRTGVVSTSNSLFGLTPNDRIGIDGITPLNNGNYVVVSSSWDNPTNNVVDAGAATWCNGSTERTGGVTIFNSTYGLATSDSVGSGGVTALSNGNYVISSTEWGNGAVTNAGAATWRDGSQNQFGGVTTSNSLVGTVAGDNVGINGVVALTNGNYVVASSQWHGTGSGSGAVTWCDGSTGRVGTVAIGNSLTGNGVGRNVTALANGNYVVGSPFWNSWTASDVGAATWGNGSTGTVGTVSAVNSLVGSTPVDYLGGNFGGADYIYSLPNGNYVVRSPSWDNGSASNSGAITLGRGSGGTVGTLTSRNSVLGTAPYTKGSENPIDFAFNSFNNTLIVGRPVDNIVTIFSYSTTPFDFDGDSRSDLSIFRPSNGQWWINRSSNTTTFVATFGQSSDRIMPADFTGDGRSDIAFFRPSTGSWFVLRSEDFSFYSFPFGVATDTPTVGDFDGDSKADAAVFRPSVATWYISRSSGGTTIQQFGAAGDVPAVADYDGDGRSDIAIFRPNGSSGAEWWRQNSSNNSVVALQFGASTDKAVPGDFTGDGRADVAFWRPSNGNWFVLRSEDLSFYAFPFGTTNDVPVPGDYDGDGKLDAAVFRPSNVNWYVQRSSGGTLIQQFGSSGDQPVPSAFVP